MGTLDNRRRGGWREGALACELAALAAIGGLLAAGCRTPGPARATMLPPPSQWTVTTNVTRTANEFSPTASPTATDVSIDLSRSTMLAAVAVNWEPDGVPPSYEVQATDDVKSERWITLASPASPGPGMQLVSFSPTLARHIRLHVPAKAGVTNPPMLKSFWPVSYAHRPTAEWLVKDATVPVQDVTPLLDDNAETSLSAPSVAPGTPVTLDIDLHLPYPVGAVKLDWASPTNRPGALSLYMSMDGANWTEVGSIDSSTPDASDLLIATRSVPVRFLRLETVAGSNGVAVAKGSASANDEGAKRSTEGKPNEAPAFVLTDLTFRDASAASKPWHLYEFAAKQAPAALAPWSLLGKQPRWTVALAQGAAAEPQVSTEGAFAGAATAPSLWPLAVVGTNVFTPTVARSASYSIPAAGVPLPAATWSFANGLSLTLKVVPIPAPATNALARPLALASYEWASTTTNALPVRLAWILRPLRIPSVAAGGGLAFIARLRAEKPAPETAPDLQEFRVNGEPLYATATPGIKFVAAPFRDADIAGALLSPPDLPEEERANDRYGLASGAWVLDTVIAPMSTTRVVVAATPPLFDADRLLRRLVTNAQSSERGTSAGLANVLPPLSGAGPNAATGMFGAGGNQAAADSPHPATAEASDAATGTARHGPRRAPPPRPDWPTTAEAAANAFDTAFSDSSFAAYARMSTFAPSAARLKVLQLQRLQVAYLLGLNGSSRLVPDATERIRLEDDIWRFAALLRTGHAEAAGRWLDLLLDAQNPTNGAIPALYAAFPLAADEPPEGATMPSAVPAPDAEQAGYHSASAQMVFACMEYYRFTHDTTFLRRAYPSMRAAMAYLQLLHDSAMPPRPSRWRHLFGSPPPPPVSFGLFPAAPNSPDRHPYAHAYWALLGWKELRAAAASLGFDEDVAWADSNCSALRGLLKLSLAHALDAEPAGAPKRLPYCPELPGFPSPYDAALLVWPVCEPDLVEPHVLLATLSSAYEPFLAVSTAAAAQAAAVRLGPGGAPAAGTPASLAAAPAPAAPRRISAETLRLLLPLSLYGRADYAREILAMLTDAVSPAPWGALPMAIPPGPSPMPSPRAAGLYALSVRQLLLHEDPATQILHLLPGCPPEWLQLGDGFSLPNAPTAYGPVTLAASIKGRRLRVNVGGSANPPGGYRLWWPAKVRPERVTVDGVALADTAFDALGATLPPHFTGTLHATFPSEFTTPRE